MKRAVVLVLGLICPTAHATDVLLCHASSHNRDVVNKLTATGLFAVIDSVNCQRRTPSAVQLEGYDAVLVYSDFWFADPVLLGDRLADYVDGGGGVVEAVFANGSVALSGRFERQGYEPITGTSQNQGFVLRMVIDAPNHPILDGVATLNGGSSSYHTFDAALGAGAVQLAHWNNGLPLVATLETFVGRTVGLNFYPPSDAAQFDFWDQATDGGLLLANALDWAGNRDKDGDGLLSDVDNCPYVANPDQEDQDSDGVGDVCDPCDDRVDPDTDDDEVCDSVDACPTFDDRIDPDGDQVPSDCDLCPRIPDPDQLDDDRDGIGDACDICPRADDPVDSDGDQACDRADVCPGHDDRIDPDGDGVPSFCDICPAAADPDQLDTDGDTNGDACDPCPWPEDPLDSDNDRACDGVDLCPGFDDRRHSDDDGIPDDCDPCPLDTLDDSDGDGSCDSDDPCIGFDDDGPDYDYDQIPDACDNCLDLYNPGQRDFDGDGFGDDCDCRIGHPEDHPGAEETCDGEDDDCDGEVDEDAVDAGIWWVDADGDGQGNAGAEVVACAPGDGLAANADDCDDGSAEARIGGTEICDGLDNDCDGVTDPEELCPPEGDPGVGASNGCGCSQGSGSGWLAGLSLLALGRRRSRPGRDGGLSIR